MDILETTRMAHWTVCIITHLFVLLGHQIFIVHTTCSLTPPSLYHPDRSWGRLAVTEEAMGIKRSMLSLDALEKGM